MTTLIWDAVSERRYEAGLDRGVLYLPDGEAVPWNGLIAVNEKFTSETEPVYFDGVKFNNIATSGDFGATLRAFTYPDEFMELEGILNYDRGLFVTEQPRSEFGLSYRTKVGNDVDGLEYYKIHVLYNLTAVPTQRSYQTLSLDLSPSEFEWDITAVPEHLAGFRPTAHLIIDSRYMDPEILVDVEAVLYGDDTLDASLPNLQSLAAFVKKWDRIIIKDNSDGTWSATTSRPDLIVMLDATTFQINEANAIFTDVEEETYEIQSSERNEDDL